MNNTRIEILKDNVWETLVLSEKSSDAIVYNKLINRIGELSTREISHTNTFSLPTVGENIRILGLNKFNYLELASNLNKKYEAKYYVDDILLQSGFLVLNNAGEGDEIKANFIDESLNLIDNWGKYTYRDFLKDDSLTKDFDYQFNLHSIVNYNMRKLSTVSKINNVTGKTFPIAYFPNNLNVVGDEFCVNTTGIRPNNVINVYQTRPVFNVKAMFDLVTETFGYTPEYDDSIDWNTIDKTTIVSEKIKGDVLIGIEESNSTLPDTQGVQISYYEEEPNFKEAIYCCDFPVGGTTPITIDPDYSDDWTTDNYKNVDSVYIPNMNYVPKVDVAEEITFKFTLPTNGTKFLTVFALWTSTQNPYLEVVDIGTFNDVDGNYVIDKEHLKEKPEFGDVFVGVFPHMTIFTNAVGQFPNSPTLDEVIESTSKIGNVTFDENYQYIDDTVDLTFAAPNKPIKDLMVGVMEKEGMLFNIKDNVIKFFGYNHYKTQVENDELYDWGEYLLEYANPKYNTDYGNTYGKVNEVGLIDPYPGNTTKIPLTSQGDSSKYKDNAQSLNKKFNDIDLVTYINNDPTDYFEYTAESMTLIEHTGTLGDLTQTNFDGDSIGTLTDLDSFANVNYAQVPESVQSWFDLVDRAVRAEPQFLLPVDVIRDLDLSKPVYLQKLGGYYIIEEVAEYRDESTPVTVKLIKMVDL